MDLESPLKIRELSVETLLTLSNSGRYLSKLGVGGIRRPLRGDSDGAATLQLHKCSISSKKYIISPNVVGTLPSIRGTSKI